MFSLLTFGPGAQIHCALAFNERNKVVSFSREDFVDVSSQSTSGIVGALVIEIFVTRQSNHRLRGRWKIFDASGGGCDFASVYGGRKFPVSLNHEFRVQTEEDTLSRMLCP